MGGLTVRNLMLTIAYDGTEYHGFQDQGRDDRPTIQRALEGAWRRLVDEEVNVIGAGRTDAGGPRRGTGRQFSHPLAGDPPSAGSLRL